MALNYFFWHQSIKGKNVYVVDNHHKALAAWALIRRHRPEAFGDSVIAKLLSGIATIRYVSNPGFLLVCDLFFKRPAMLGIQVKIP
jgi:hypothetical protein